MPPGGNGHAKLPQFLLVELSLLNHLKIIWYFPCNFFIHSFWLEFIWSFFAEVASWQLVSIGLGNVLEPHMGQAISWTNDERIHWHRCNRFHPWIPTLFAIRCNDFASLRGMAIRTIIVRITVISHEHHGVWKHWQLDYLFNTFASYQKRKHQSVHLFISTTDPTSIKKYLVEVEPADDLVAPVSEHHAGYHPHPCTPPRPSPLARSPLWLSGLKNNTTRYELRGVSTHWQLDCLFNSCISLK